jgi:hypothetical protein
MRIRGSESKELYLLLFIFVSLHGAQGCFLPGDGNTNPVHSLNKQCMIVSCLCDEMLHKKKEDSEWMMLIAHMRLARWICLSSFVNLSSYYMYEELGCIKNKVQAMCTKMQELRMRKSLCTAEQLVFLDCVEHDVNALLTVLEFILDR